MTILQSWVFNPEQIEIKGKEFETVPPNTFLFVLVLPETHEFLVFLNDAYSFSSIVVFISALKYPLQMSPAKQCYAGKVTEP